MNKRRSDGVFGHVMSMFSMRRQYFSDARGEILKYNLRTLRNSSLAGLFMLFFLILVSPYIVKGWKPTLEYWLLAPTLIAFFAFSMIYQRVKNKSYQVIQIACVLFYVAIFAHFIAISVFPYPETPESYITILLLMMPVLFILKPSTVLAISVVMGAVFCVLVVKFKTPVCVSHDVFSTFAGTLFGQFVSFFIYSLRISDYNSRMSLYEWSRTDPLTGLLNKAACENTINSYLQYRWKGEDYAAIMLDIDDFKKVNDTLGHPEGDKLLRATGIALRHSFRSTDVLARVGGDEFFLLMKGITDHAAVIAKAREINSVVSEFVRERTGITPTYSVGVAFGQNDATFDPCFRRADQALYNAKRAGKHGYSVWKEESEL